MFDSLPHNDRALLVGNGGAHKLTLNGSLTRAEWDAIFGAGTADALDERSGGKPLDARSGWTRQGWYRKCADVRAKAVQTLPWALYEAGADNDAKPLWQSEDVSVPKGLEVLDGLDTALYLSEAGLSLSGAFYFGKGMLEQGRRLQGSRLQRFSGLMYWSPLTVEPDWSTGALMFKRRIGQQIIDVDPAAVVWGWQPDPFVEFGPGASDGGAAGISAAALDSLARFLTRHLDSGLVKMTVLAVEGNTTPEQRSDLRGVWARLLRRGSDVNGPPVLSEKITPHTIGEGLKDVGTKEITEEQRQAISTTFGIPWSVLSGESANYATAQVEERGFYLRTVIPQARIIERALNLRLFKEYGLTFRFEPERHEVMQQYELSKAEQIAQISGGKAVLTRNELRELLGYEPIEGWEEEDRSEAPQVVSPAGGDGAAVEVRSVQVDRLTEKVAKILAEGR